MENFPYASLVHRTLIFLAIFMLILTMGNFFYVTYLSGKIQYLEQMLKKEPAKETSQISVSSASACPSSCMTKIEEIKTNISQQIQNTPEISSVIRTESPKELFIAFGAGTGASENWEDVPGLLAVIDTNNYPTIRSATFEATLYIPTGNQTAYVRLYNVTDKHPVWQSELSLDGGVGKLLTSPSFKLDPGKKTYQVQMKTSLKYQTILNQSRLHLLF